MTTLASHFLSLARNSHWSNYRLHRACEKLSSKAYFAKRKSFFGTIHATLDHILIVDLLYLGRLEGKPRVPADCEVLCRDFASLRQRQSDVDGEIIAYCQHLDDPTLESNVTYTASTQQTYTETVSNVLTHLFLHQVHHRGQVHDMLAQTSVAPPQLDEFFLAGDLPLREKELTDLGLPCR